jgi:hypothetical protein
MKQHILFSMVILIFSCSNRNNEDADSRLVYRTDTLTYDKELNTIENGFLILDLLSLKQNEGSVSFYRGKEEYIKLDSKSVTVDKAKCNYFEKACENLIDGSTFINLEFDLFVVPCNRKTADSLFVFLNDNWLTVPIQNPYVRFESYRTHLQNSLVTIDSAKCLRHEPSEEGICINDADQYLFEVIEFNGSWVKVKVEETQFDTSFTGWIEWIKNDSLLIKPSYGF